MPLQVITFAAADRPECEVLVDDVWHFADLRQWTQHDDGTWSADVRWYTDATSRLDTFPTDRIRRPVDPLRLR